MFTEANALGLGSFPVKESVIVNPYLEGVINFIEVYDWAGRKIDLILNED